MPGTPTETAEARFPAMLVGYVRVSTADERQSTGLQRDALRAAGVDERHVYEDRALAGIASAAEVEAAHVVVVRQLGRGTGEADVAGLEDVGAAADFERHAAVLLDQ